MRKKSGGASRSRGALVGESHGLGGWLDTRSESLRGPGRADFFAASVTTRSPAPAPKRTQAERVAASQIQPASVASRSARDAAAGSEAPSTETLDGAASTRMRSVTGRGAAGRPCKRDPVG